MKSFQSLLVTLKLTKTVFTFACKIIHVPCLLIAVFYAEYSPGKPPSWIQSNSMNAPIENDYLVKVIRPEIGSHQPFQVANFASFLQKNGAQIETLVTMPRTEWIRVRANSNIAATLMGMPGVIAVQRNFPLNLLEDYSIQDPLRLKALRRYVARNDEASHDLLNDAGRSEAKPPRRGEPQPDPGPVDNPEIPAPATDVLAGLDPLLNLQWGMSSIRAPMGWSVTLGSPEVIVAVIDTGVDYTHEDLVGNLWRNSKEIPGNQVDDDGNGFVDDIIGWDFSANDNRPYDMTMKPLDILFRGGNPGHGTHCAGNIAARGNNGIGISGVAPNVKIISLRFVNEKGKGDTAGAIKAIKYAVDNGAKILSNSWGGEGNPNDPAEENIALKEMIAYAETKNVLFVAAAGNGRNGAGFNNDSDPYPIIPASYEFPNIISVAAIDRNDALASFSNWGENRVHIGAPGVAVFSTVVNNKYSDIVIDKLGFTALWSGTSMAAPHVAGAAALYLSLHPQASFSDIKSALIQSAQPIPSLTHKVFSQGKLDIEKLVTMP